MKKFLFFILFLFIIYFFSNLVISLINISNSVSNNNAATLKKYLAIENLRLNFKNDIYELRKFYYKMNIQNLSINNKSILITGEITDSFIDKLFKNISQTISNDLSDTDNMLFFYFNSKDLERYFNYVLVNFGENDFKKYFLEEYKPKRNIINKNESSNQQLLLKTEKKNNLISVIKQKISKLSKKYKNTEHFFFISPLHFKLVVRHQDILFSVVFKFTGYRWVVNEIIIPFDKFTTEVGY